MNVRWECECASFVKEDCGEVRKRNLGYQWWSESISGNEVYTGDIEKLQIFILMFFTVHYWGLSVC